MSIPEERLPEVDESESYVEQPTNTSNDEELDFESSAADESDDDLDSEESSEADTAGFGFGEPAE